MGYTNGSHNSDVHLRVWKPLGDINRTEDTTRISIQAIPGLGGIDVCRYVPTDQSAATGGHEGEGDHVEVAEGGIGRL